MNRLVASSHRVAWISEHVEQTLNPKPWLSFGFLGFGPGTDLEPPL